MNDSCNTMKRLAILGGEAAITKTRLDLFKWPIVTEEDEQAVLAVLRSGDMSGTGITKKFEEEYAAWVGARHALGYCNGTSALLGAFWGCGIGAGDEVICPSITYWASCTAVLGLGATVNFADIDPDTLCIDPNDIEHRIGPRTKAIIAVHYTAHPCDMDRINAIASKYGVQVIEDASHAPGSLYCGRHCGTLGDVAGLSMMSGKSFAIGAASTPSGIYRGLGQSPGGNYSLLTVSIGQATGQNGPARRSVLTSIPATARLRSKAIFRLRWGGGFDRVVPHWAPVCMPNRH